MKTNKFIDLIKNNWLQIMFWVITCILLIVVIAIFVSWQTSMNEKYVVSQNEEGKDLYNLTTNAIKQQNIVAALSFSFVISLSISIFTTVLISYKNKKGRKK